MRKQRAGPAGGGVSEDEETALLERVAAEEKDAFDTLYRLYRPRLQRFLRGLTKQPGSVGEILDDTMMVVWRKAYTFNHLSKVSTWIFAIAYRQSLKALRRLGEPEEPESGERADLLAPGPDDVLQHQELRKHLDDALGTLSPEQRAVIELTYYFGYACSEIAQIMACPVDTVKTRMFYARRKLKASLASCREAI
ncbi:RNA polymerase sigma factor [Dyella flava]|uniref:RNA polymerase sigma factor n=1 Tax=Dyella flava TaxID=1920170 RepID=A0ABS2K1G7_9GAMM|nr:RNA polymerase sigma factor [Dyella flava]MBM7124959.1 RNA polymerase sigma factor [Dyella flava]GLQ49913.1 RNA polymerase sigma factor [Dyella flava]